MNPTTSKHTPAPLGRRARLASAIALLSLIASSCSAAEEIAQAFQPTTTTSAPQELVVSTPPPEPTAAGVCIDATSSVEDQVRTDSLEAITNTLASASASEPRSNAEARPPIPGLFLSVGWMTANGYDTKATVADAHLMPVDGVIARPTADIDADRAFLPRAEAIRNWVTASATRRDEVTTIVSRLRSATRPKPRSSDILGCAAARAQRLRDMAATRGRILIVSDMIESGPQQQGGRLDGFDVEIVLVCIESESCDALTTSWTERLKSMGARDVRVSRLESLTEAARRLFDTTSTGPVRSSTSSTAPVVS